MAPIEMTCEKCAARMRLSEALRHKLEGRTGRVECRGCGNRLSLDARGASLLVVSGGSLDEFRKGDTEITRRKDSANISGERLVPPRLPSSGQRNTTASSVRSGGRGSGEQEGSLSPHTLSDDDDSMVRLGREFDSAPYAAPSPRDATYDSLFPGVAASETSRSDPVPLGENHSAVPAPPRAGELHRASAAAQGAFDEMFGVSPNSAPRNVVVSSDGRLLNDSDLVSTTSARPQDEGSSTGVLPWIFAAATLLALGSAFAAGGASPVTDLRDRIVGSGSTMEPVLVLDRASSAAVARYDRRELAPVESPFALEPIATAVSATRGRSSTPARVSSVSIREPQVSGKDEQKLKDKNEVTAPFSTGAASLALRQATAQASSCRKPTDPNGKARVLVTFAPSGRVTSATVSGPPYAGTSTGGCIASRFRAARVPAFLGDRVTVSKTVTIR